MKRKFTRPRMYYQEGKMDNQMHPDNGRFRIIYPDGLCEFAYDYVLADPENMISKPKAEVDPTDYFFNKSFKDTCWSLKGASAETQLERMQGYDVHFTSKTIYLGEI